MPPLAMLALGSAAAFSGIGYAVSEALKQPDIPPPADPAELERRAQAERTAAETEAERRQRATLLAEERRRTRPIATSPRGVLGEPSTAAPTLLGIGRQRLLGGGRPRV